MEALAPAVFTQLVFKAMDGLCGLPVQLTALGVDLTAAVAFTEKLQQAIRRLYTLPDSGVSLSRPTFPPTSPPLRATSCSAATPSDRKTCAAAFSMKS